MFYVVKFVNFGQFWSFGGSSKFLSIILAKIVDPQGATCPQMVPPTAPLHLAPYPHTGGAMGVRNEADTLGPKLYLETYISIGNYKKI